MALSQSAVSELLDAFRAGDGVDLIRESVQLVLQERQFASVVPSVSHPFKTLVSQCSVSVGHPVICHPPSLHS